LGERKKGSKPFEQGEEKRINRGDLTHICQTGDENARPFQGKNEHAQGKRKGRRGPQAIAPRPVSGGAAKLQQVVSREKGQQISTGAEREKEIV